MNELTNEHISFLIKDLYQRGIIVEGIRDEVIDHVCSAVEAEMKKGVRFLDAYQEVIKRFGDTSGLQSTQLQTIKSDNQKATRMIRNYFVIAYRNLMKQGFYSVINVLGLAVGISSCIIILLYVHNETSYDKHFEDADRLYRVNSEIKFGANHLVMAVCPAPLSETVRKDYPEVEASARLWDGAPSIFVRGDDSFKESATIFADSSIFSVFPMTFLEGNPDRALTEPNTIVISRTAAEKYFPGEKALGQFLTGQRNNQWKVTGVIEDMPSTGHFKFDFLLSLVTVDYHRDQNWLSNNFHTYIKLREGADARELESKFPKMIDTYAGPQAKQALGSDFTMEKFRAGGNKLEYTLMKVTDIHLRSDKDVELSANSDITYVYLFTAIALFILVIACINFMNLSTARSANRAKEVGIRKVMGSFRSHLVRQFLLESLLLSAVSFVLAIAIAWLTIPAFNDLARKQLALPLSDPTFWLIIIAGATVVGIFSGFYPSFFLSAFKPVNVLKGNLARGGKSSFIRGALVVFQFWISIVLVVGTIAVNRQLAFIQNKKIGFNKDQVIVVRDTYALGRQVHSFKDEVLKDSRISIGTISGYLPVASNRSDNAHWPEGVPPTDENLVSIQCWAVDHDYVKTLGMNIIQGRDFSKEFPSDSGAVILNQAALHMFGFETDPIGKRIATFGEGPPSATDVADIVSFPVIGVVEDFHWESMRNSIGPVALFLRRNNSSVSFRFTTTNTQEVVGLIEQQWKKVAGGLPFDYSFLDEEFSRMYAAEQRLGQVFTVFSVLAIVIACLGLFALTAFTAEQRTKEIGIRKVLGASVSGIVVLLSSEFGKLILIAFVLAVPVAWYAIGWWLKDFTYKTEVGVAVYALAGISAFVIAWLTMSFQSIKAAVSNPIKSLRSE
jgi:putative ABC transport system permease protein